MRKALFSISKSSEVILDPLVYLPGECWFKIFSYLNIQELARCSQVSKSWHKIAVDNSLWKKYFPAITIPFDVGFKKNIDSYVQKYFKSRSVIKSKIDLEKQIQKFANRVTLKKMGTFLCLFPFNPGCEVVIRLAYGRIGEEVDVDSPWEQKIKESCIFMRTLPNLKGCMERLALDCSSIDPVECYVFNRKLETISWKVLTCEVSLALPFAGEENPILLNKIENILKNRVQKLKALDEMHYRIYVLGVLFLVVSVGVVVWKICF